MTGSGGAGRRVGGAGARPRTKSSRKRELTTPTKVSIFEKTTAAVSSHADELQGLAFSSRPEDLDPAQAAALMGRAGDAVLVAKLRAVFGSPEGCVIGAFARIAGDADSDSDADGGGGGGYGGGNVISAMVAMGLEMLAGECNIEGKTLVGFAQAATDAAMVATVDMVVVGKDHARTREERRGGNKKPVLSVSLLVKKKKTKQTNPLPVNPRTSYRRRCHTNPLHRNSKP